MQLWLLTESHLAEVSVHRDGSFSSRVFRVFWGSILDVPETKLHRHPALSNRAELHIFELGSYTVDAKPFARLSFKTHALVG